MQININPNRPIEELVGDNFGIVVMRLGNTHVGTSYMQALRICRPKNMRAVPVPLRRGWAKTVLEVHAANRAEYRHVMG